MTDANAVENTNQHQIQKEGDKYRSSGSFSSRAVILFLPYPLWACGRKEIYTIALHLPAQQQRQVISRLAPKPRTQTETNVVCEISSF